jgi:hypothetical protein
VNNSGSSRVAACRYACWSIGWWTFFQRRGCLIVPWSHPVPKLRSVVVESTFRIVVHATFPQHNRTCSRRLGDRNHHNPKSGDSKPSSTLQCRCARTQAIARSPLSAAPASTTNLTDSLTQPHRWPTQPHRCPTSPVAQHNLIDSLTQTHR